MDPAVAGKSFRYPPLTNAKEQIRLLHIKDGAADSIIACTLERYTYRESNRSLSATPSTQEDGEIPLYVAISYTWGGQNPSKEIRVNGRRMLVTANCWNALWQARFHRAIRTLPEPNTFFAEPKGFRAQAFRIVSSLSRLRMFSKGTMPVFVDAICIAQNDTYEKAHQVQMMGSIYRNAHEVLICPGPVEEDSDYFFEGARKLLTMTYESELWTSAVPTADSNNDRVKEGKRTAHENAQVSEDESYSFNVNVAARSIPGAPEFSGKRPYVNASTDSSMRKRARISRRFFEDLGPSTCKRWCLAFLTFANRLYWTRAWTLQETLIALVPYPVIICGQHIQTLTDMIYILGVLQNVDSDWEYMGFEDQYFRDLTGTSLTVFARDIKQSGMFSSTRRSMEGRPSKGEVRTTHEALSGFSTLTDSNRWNMELLGCKESRDRVYCLLDILPWRECTGPPIVDYQDSQVQVVVGTFRSIHGAEMILPFKVMSKLIRWLELGKDAEGSLSLLFSERLAVLNYDSVSSRRNEIEEACPKDHKSSITAAPRPIFNYCPVFRARSGNLAIFAGNLSPTEQTLPFKNITLTGQGTSTLEIYHLDMHFQPACTRCEVPVQLQEGDIVAEVDVLRDDRVLDGIEPLQDPEGWVFREVKSGVFEIVACGQLREILGPSAQPSLCCGSVSNTTQGCKCLAKADHAMHKDRTGMNLELHLDPEDALIYTTLQPEWSSTNRDVLRERARYLSNELPFSRAKFSSFATFRPDGYNVDNNMAICIYCGQSLN